MLLVILNKIHCNRRYKVPAEESKRLRIKSQHNCFEASVFSVPLKCNGGRSTPTHTAENHNQQLSHSNHFSQKDFKLN